MYTVRPPTPRKLSGERSNSGPGAGGASRAWRSATLPHRPVLSGRQAIERRVQGEVRSDIDPALIVSILDWTMERFQDALLTEELDPGLFPHPADPEKNQARINQFLLVLRGAIGV